MTKSSNLVVAAFAAVVGSAAFLDDLLESRPVRGADLLLAALLAALAAVALITVTRLSAASRRHGAEVERLRGLNKEMCLAGVDALSVALDFRDQYTGAHSGYVLDLAMQVGERLGLGGDDLAELNLGARLHDLGKLGVPDAVLHKEGPLDDEEQALMRMHPIWGEQLLRQVPGLERVAVIVRAEHERWDGAGYPDGLRGEQIPLASRIILACDAYHAMTSDRPYRKALPHDTALQELRLNADRQFDGSVVTALLRVFDSTIPVPERVPVGAGASA